MRFDSRKAQAIAAKRQNRSWTVPTASRSLDRSPFLIVQQPQDRAALVRVGASQRGAKGLHQLEIAAAGENGPNRRLRAEGPCDVGRPNLPRYLGEILTRDAEV